MSLTQSSESVIKPTDLAADIAANPTVFGKLMRGELPINKVYEDESTLAFHTIEPCAPVHLLIIPKWHIESMQKVKPEHADIIGKMLAAVPKIAKELGVSESGYRLITNCGKDAGQEVYHIHFHLLAGEPLGPLRA